MFFSRSLLISLVATPLLALAQSNPFNVPQGGYNATAGQSLSLSWSPTTTGTVSLVLRSGASSDLEAGSIIAMNITNSGSYSWAIPSSTLRGSDYTVEIVDDANNALINFTPYFVIESLVTVATTSASNVALGATASLPISSTATVHSASTTGSATGSASSASTTGSASSGTASSHSTTGSMTTSASTSAANTAASTSAHPVSTGAGARATAAVGMLGALALGALAL